MGKEMSACLMKITGKQQITSPKEMKIPRRIAEEIKITTESSFKV